MNELIERASDIVPAISRLEKFMLAQEKQPECPVVHHFGPGIYIREVIIPADTFAIGHRQKFDHMNVFLKGRVTVFKEDGTTVEWKAPMMFTAPPGRKVGYVHEDMVWLNIYSTQERDIEKLEETYLEKNLSFKEADELRRQRHTIQFEIDREDFKSVPHGTGPMASKEKMDFPDGSVMIKIGRSDIHGLGIIATGFHKKGYSITSGPIVERYVNHSKFPNAKMVRGPGGQVELIAIRDISGCHGGYDGDEITIDYRQAGVPKEEKWQA